SSCSPPASGYGAPPALPSFPTRRSSDLERLDVRGREELGHHDEGHRGGVPARPGARPGDAAADRLQPTADLPGPLGHARLFVMRSEEHTSELQSRENLVCRLLLEKKKNR